MHCAHGLQKNVVVNAAGVGGSLRDGRDGLSIIDIIRTTAPEPATGGRITALTSRSPRQLLLQPFRLPIFLDL